MEKKAPPTRPEAKKKKKKTGLQRALKVGNELIGKRPLSIFLGGVQK